MILNFTNFLLESNKFSSKKYIQYFKYELVETYPLSDLEKYKDHRRLQVFYLKGVKCPNCNIEGEILTKSVDRKGAIHIDVCTKELYPFTIDHIIPKSKGGKDYIDNLRPMCCVCNWERGNGDLTPAESRKKYSFPKRYPKNTDPDILKEVTDIKVGDTVYKKITGKLLGVVTEILPNPNHPTNAMSCKIEGKFDTSLFTLKSLCKEVV